MYSKEIINGVWWALGGIREAAESNDYGALGIDSEERDIMRRIGVCLDKARRYLHDADDLLSQLEAWEFAHNTEAK